MKEKIKKFLKKYPKFYKITKNIFWKIQGIRQKIFGTEIQERYWQNRHLLKKNDWADNEDWITSYWKSRSHPHRRLLIDKICQHSPLSILEIGSHCGPNLYLLAKKFSKIKIIGIDINSEAIQAGNKLFAKEKILNVKLITEKADNLSQFKDKSFDIVFTDATLLYIGSDKIKKVVSEIERVCKKVIIITEHHSEKENSLGTFNKGNWVRNYKKLFGAFSREVKITKISPKIWGGDWGKLGYIIEIKL